MGWVCAWKKKTQNHWMTKIKREVVNLEKNEVEVMLLTASFFNSFEYNFQTIYDKENDSELFTTMETTKS